MDYIFDKFKRSHKGIKVLRTHAKEQIKKKEKQTRPLDSPLSIIIFLLVNHLKAKLKSPRWKLICDFLAEQKLLNIDNVDITEESLRDRYRKTPENKAAIRIL